MLNKNLTNMRNPKSFLSSYSFSMPRNAISYDAA